VDNWRRVETYGEALGNIAGSGGTASTGTIVTLAAGDDLSIYGLRFGGTTLTEITIEIQVGGVTILTFYLNGGLGVGGEVIGLHGGTYLMENSAAGGALTIKVTNDAAGACNTAAVQFLYTNG
jgi:hypothetical protein